MSQFFFDLDRTSPVPLPEQIYRAGRDAIRAGALRGGARLPSVRALAGVLGIARGTASEGYALLAAEGLIALRPGAAPRVSEAEAPLASAAPSPAPALTQAGERVAADPRARQQVGRGTFAPGQPDPALFPRDVWARALRRAVRTLPPNVLAYEDTQGLPALRDALARLVGETRGLRAAPGDVLVLPTVQSAMTLIAACLTTPGDLVAVEDPGYAGARAAFGASRLAPLPVGGDGADPGALPGDARLACLTPSHHYPTGARLSADRRAAFLAHARTHGTLIVEDDYDSEFLWRGRAVPALAASDPSRVLFLGTVAKSLLPGLRLAYVVLPPGLAPAFVRAQRNLGLLTNVHAQAALAEMIEGGQYRAHLRRISNAYEARATMMASALEAALGNRASVAEPTGGLQLLCEFSKGTDDRAVAERLAAEGYAPSVLSGMALRSGRCGLVVGFGTADEAGAGRFAISVARALASSSSRRTA